MIQEVVKALKERDRKVQEKETRKSAALRRLETDPFDFEAQKIIEEMVRMNNIEDNLDAAYLNPAMLKKLGPALYIDVHINGLPIKVLVDSGMYVCMYINICMYV